MNGSHMYLDPRSITYESSSKLKNSFRRSRKNRNQLRGKQFEQRVSNSFIELFTKFDLLWLNFVNRYNHVADKMDQQSKKGEKLEGGI